MHRVHFTLGNQSKRELEKMLAKAIKFGNLREVTRLKAVLAVFDGQPVKIVAQILRVSVEAIRIWLNKLVLLGPSGLKTKKAPGRASRLTKTQRKELKRLISRGPQYCGFPGACWRSPMIQEMILARFGVLYCAYYIPQLLKNMGFSYQKATFVAAKRSREDRQKWIKETWPEIVKLAKDKNAHILFGDEASFPQWGSLTRTWGKRGKQPTTKTSGIRKGYKVLGLIDYFTGQFYSMGHEGRLNSEIYEEFLKSVLSKTKKHIILIQDGAPYHKSKAMRKFFEKNSNRITVYRLPSYSPDYNPIEKLWKKIKEKEVHLHYFPTFDSLKNKVNEALLNFQNMSKDILSLFVKYNKLSDAISD